MNPGVGHTHSEFVDLTNRSEKAFWFLVNGPMHPTRPSWNWDRVVRGRNMYQRALAAWARANPNNGVVDMLQARAVEHLSYVDRVLWRVYHRGAGPMNLHRVCRAESEGTGGDKVWTCLTHGSKLMCRKSYEDMLEQQNY